MFLYTEAILAICCSIDVELTSLPPFLLAPAVHLQRERPRRRSMTH